jgi:hypothetical protein
MKSAASYLHPRKRGRGRPPAHTTPKEIENAAD